MLIQTTVKAKIMKIFFIFYLYILSFSVFSEEIPKLMIENVDSLATLKAPLNLCTNTNNFNKLEVKKQINYIGLAAKIDGMALKIQTHYHDKTIFEFYLRMVSKYSDSQSANVIIKKYGGLCTEKMLYEIEGIFNESEGQMNRFLK